MDVVTIGETMVVFTSAPGLMRYSNSFSRKFGGSESNLAIGLSRMGYKVGWISRIGNDEFGKALLNFIRGEGVDVSEVNIDEEAPTGIYFKEIRNSNDIRVYYYRKGSAASRMNKADLNEEYIAKAKYVFISGITSALSDSCHDTVMETINIAKKHNVKIVFDPNIRKKLWSEEKARKVLLEIAAQVDIILPGVSEGEFLFGESDPSKLGELFLKQGPSLVVLKVGEKGAYYFTQDSKKLVPGFFVEQVVDPVGAGDGFASGFLSGLLDGLDIYESVQRGNAIGAIVTMVNGDVEGLPEREDLENFLNKPSDNVNR